jgi:chromosome segregation ATPase
MVSKNYGIINTEDIRSLIDELSYVNSMVVPHVQSTVKSLDELLEHKLTDSDIENMKRVLHMLDIRTKAVADKLTSTMNLMQSMLDGNLVAEFKEKAKKAIVSLQEEQQFKLESLIQKISTLDEKLDTNVTESQKLYEEVQQYSLDIKENLNDTYQQRVDNIHMMEVIKDTIEKELAEIHEVITANKHIKINNEILFSDFAKRLEQIENKNHFWIKTILAIATFASMSSLAIAIIGILHS